VTIRHVEDMFGGLTIPGDTQSILVRLLELLDEHRTKSIFSLLDDPNFDVRVDKCLYLLFRQRFPNVCFVDLDWWEEAISRRLKEVSDEADQQEEGA